ncbi:MAG: glucose-6-phosphate dehydrogenase, partial [Thermoplasmata archaeon]|nr:glucose-6-phosphate dehydrogenase [Thermoplasmata archaeon]
GAIGRNDVVFGQYQGYREEPKVDADSSTPTFVALRLFINNWRWHGVPFYIRSGKCLPRKLTEVIIQFKNVPLSIFGDEELCRRAMKPNTLFIRIQPDEGIRLSFTTRVPGMTDKFDHVNLDFRYSTLGSELSEAYERVILDGLDNKPALFWRNDGIEAAWRVVAPLLDNFPGGPASSLAIYEPGTWGPEEAGRLLEAEQKRWLDSY